MNEPLKGRMPRTSCSSRNSRTHTASIRRLTSATGETGRTELRHGRSSPNVLAVIPDPNICKSIFGVIGKTGVGVTAVSSLREAREILEHERASLVICSAHLSDGTFRELLSLSPRLFAGMVVLCSGNCPAGARIDALELGIMDYVGYPLPLEELQWVIHSAITRSLEGQAISTATA